MLCHPELARTVPPEKTARVSGCSGGVAAGPGKREATARGRAGSPGAPGAGVWLELGQYLLWESGTWRARWPPFQCRRHPPPCAGGSAAPRANEWQLTNLERERARDPSCRNCGGGGGGRDPSSLFPPARPSGLRDGNCSSSAGWSAAPEGVVSVCSEAGRAVAWESGEGSPGSRAPLPACPLPPPVPPSLSFWFLPQAGWTGADLPQTYGERPRSLMTA